MSESISISQIYEELKRIEKTMATKEDVHTLLDSLEIATNPATMKQIMESKEDIKRGRVKKITSAKELLEEM
ncbi:hypothetical protein HYU22_03130 [Candidatus Woesearchaeota archaeon]|nr:hypothetical protein [Candidatus Woesearchaeota archaeon]